MFSHKGMPCKIATPIKRVLAFVVDMFFIIPLITICILTTNSILNLPVTPNFSIYGFEIIMDEWAQQHFWQVVLIYSGIKLSILFFYFTLFEASAWQATPGKRLLKIKVTNLISERISLGKSAIRFFSKILSTQLLIGYLMIFFTKRKQGLHDLIAKTIVQEIRKQCTG
jgi:uncharacterized RDD family membrane protein YckC